MTCPYCGKEIEEGYSFCIHCGAQLVEKTAEENAIETSAAHFENEHSETDTAESRAEDNKTEENKREEKKYEENNKMNECIPDEYKPISMWGYFGYELLFSIPLVGLIVAIVLAFGANQNKNVINYARARFCWLIIGLVISIAIVSFGLVAGLLGAF